MPFRRYNITGPGVGVTLLAGMLFDFWPLVALAGACGVAYVVTGKRLVLKRTDQ